MLRSFCCCCSLSKQKIIETTNRNRYRNCNRYRKHNMRKHKQQLIRLFTILIFTTFTFKFGSRILF